MNKKQYWKIRAFIINLVFKINSARYHFTCKADGFKRERLISIFILRNIVKTIILYSLLAIVLYKADSLLMFYSKSESAQDIGTITAIIVGGIGIAGVILGLYCSSIASIYSQIYSNAPKSISEAFHSDIITNRSIKQITGFITFGSILLIECVAIRCPYYVSLIVFLVLSVCLIIAFGITRNRTYMLSDSYRLSENIYPIIFSSMKNAIKHSYVGEDVSFQNHLHTVVSKQLETIKDIAIYNQNNALNNNTAMVQFMKSNLYLLNQYWEIKAQIPFDSSWYEEQIEYQQWHLVSDQAVQLHTKTGTALDPSKKRNHTWFEERIYEINTICFDKLCKDKDYNNIYSYLLLVGNTSKYAAKGYSLYFWRMRLTELKDKIILLCNNTEITADNSDIVIAIVDAMTISYLGLIISIYQVLKNLNYQRIMEHIIEIADSGSLNITEHKFYNTKSMKNLLKQIRTEIEIEHKRITPDWYIEQIVAKEIYDYCNEAIEMLTSVFTSVLDLGTRIGETGRQTLAVVALCRFFEMQSKCTMVNQIVGEIIPVLENAHKEKNVIWDKCRFSDFQKFQKDIFNQFVDKTVSYSESFAITNWNNREKQPDFLGECYNNICENLIQAIENNDFDRYKNMYVLLLKLTIVYKEYIKSDLIKHKEEYLQNRIVYVVTAPYVEFAKISSFAIIWGEFIEDPQWKMLIETETKAFMTNKAEHEFIEQIPSIVQTRWQMLFGIGNRDIIHSDWDLRIANAIRYSSACQYEYHEYGRKALKTNSQMLQSFCSDYFDTMGFSNPPEDVYILVCLNDLLEPDKRYYGRYDWGKKLNEK